MMKQISVWLSYQKKMKSVQSMLATWDLGIMIEHENFGLEVTNDDGVSPCGRGAVVERTPSVTKVVSSILAQSERDFVGGRERTL